MRQVKYEIGDVVQYAGNDYFVAGFPEHAIFDMTLLPVDCFDFFGDVDLKSKILLTTKSKMVRMINVTKR